MGASSWANLVDEMRFRTRRFNDSTIERMIGQTANDFEASLLSEALHNVRSALQALERLRQRQVLDCIAIFGPSCAYAIEETLGLTENQINPVVCRLTQKGVLIHVCDGETPHEVRCSIVDIAEKGVVE